jgi:CRP/FNR family transcriptional regulator, cyclic AMP receptor protein
MRRLDEVLRDVPFFAGMSEAQVALIAGCGSNASFDAGEVLVREGDAADTFYVVRHGTVAIDVHSPTRGSLTVETIGPGEIVGWSWLFPPHVWQFDARAVDDVRAVEFDGACLRGKCESDHALGYELMRRFAAVMIDRLQHTRLRLLDLYGSDSDS